MGCFVREEPRRVEIGNEQIRVSWTRLRGNLIARTGGGVFYREGREWMKVAELAEGDCTISSGTGDKSPNFPVSGRVIAKGGEAVMRLEFPLVHTGTTDWRIEGEWRIISGENRVHWSYEFIPSWHLEFTPSGPLEQKFLLSVNFNVLPNVWRNLTVPSCCGYKEGDICYAVFPEKEDPFWMRLEDPEWVRNNVNSLEIMKYKHYASSYKPSKYSKGLQKVRLAGWFLVDRIDPRMLHQTLWNYLKPVPNQAVRSLNETSKLAFDFLCRSFQEAVRTGYFVPGEGAFTDLATGYDWFHMYSPSTYGVGFSCGYAGGSIAFLLEYYRAKKDRRAQEMARSIANWVCRRVQATYGGYHNMYDVILREGFEMAGEDYINPHTTGRIAANIFSAYKHFGAEEYKNSALNACDWLLKIQEQDGALPYRLVASTGEPDGVKAYAATALQVASAWLAAYEITGKKHYLKSSRKLAEWVESRFLCRRIISGYFSYERPANGLSDWEVPSVSAPSFVIEALSNLYRVTDDRKYLNQAEEVGYLNSLWQWLWEFPEGSLGKRVKGTCQAGYGMSYTIDQILGNELPNVIDGFLTLYELTGKKHWLQLAELGLPCLAEYQHSIPGQPMYGAICEGWSLTEDRFLPHPTGLAGGTAYLLHVIIKYRQLTRRNRR
ncbi:MAG: hypothetical protein V2A65_09640 [Candidatus Omnitrophota bacterium]